jgi:very-short-patch-repair endonuclease
MAPKLTYFVKRLRKNFTKAEALSWNRLRARQIEGIKFRRQQPIENFIVDFVSFEKRIVMELDGGQYVMNKKKDNERDRFLTKNGFKDRRIQNAFCFGGVNEQQFMHFMINETAGLLASTIEVLGMHVDLKIRRAAPMLPEIADKFDAKLAKDQRLSWEAPVCGVIQL